MEDSYLMFSLFWILYKKTHATFIIIKQCYSDWKNTKWAFNGQTEGTQNKVAKI
jgi:hypothetical protein